MHKQETTYDFLKNFHKRIEIVAIVEFITTRVSRKLKFKEYGIDNNEAINLLMLVLCFIMEKSLVEEACTRNDVAAFIRKMDIEYLGKNIPDEKYTDISDILIKDCLQNNGIPHYFSTYNFDAGEEEKINVKLIDDKRVALENESIYSYYMTPQGYRFMFNTLEIEDAMQVSIEQFKLSLSIKKKNFSAARNNVDSLYNISKTQIQRINYFIKKVKEDIGSTGIEEYENIYNATFASIDEQKEGYDSLYQLIYKVEDTIMESNQAKLDREALKREVRNISYIKNRLKLIINEQSALLLKQQELQKVYDEAIDNILYIGFDDRLNFEEAVTKRLEENPDLAYPLTQILRSLFKPKLDKFFNIKMALKEQRTMQADSGNEGNNILMSQRYFHQLESENDIKIRVLNEQYLNIFEIICQCALDSPDKEVLLSDLTADLKGKYESFVPNLKILTNMLLQLSSMKYVDFTAIKTQKRKTIFNPSEEFDIKYCVLALLDRNEAYHRISHMEITLVRNKNIWIPEKRMEAEDTKSDSFIKSSVTGLNCPDILFRIEVEKFE